ncbi:MULTISPECIES: DUF4168 domain-containing protein [Chromohalobacter]|uniref:DUF4168 domain-containing protein n=1 Tax=Chromohalobacter israelensis (strain ATCC BAA-138 / DSM 3043 / CIP 106854 / NCIMB 13768 / 1H11) TaxID=290398 RepID=Q1QYR6_CHRI1|nr:MULTISPECIES: DUF4168 domain-containing protein [Chromohalobacter]ABE58392.1 conserved hypothetical protein [Chromohalobacter salexigens DSM 3043]MDF9433158.1 DUF4168 domain-containing protein [Chromohalobacter israelensis]MDO0944473.1 DUF4168 domain-containing protein [Chromohalobacter salexigens]NQY46043.1 DUF4168 domain-containing protein [Chromohalobacter sp.]NWO55729.1 DUF4168 domain-containing protein [Chromohalobacter salexigens]
MQRITAFVSAAMLTTGMVAAPAAMAQQEDPAASGAGQTQQGAAAQNFSDEQLQQFADASQEIAKVSQEYTQKLQNAEDESAQQDLRQEANEEMVSVVEDSGMSVEDFNAIGQAIQQDPELMQRVQGMVQEQQ